MSYILLKTEDEVRKVCAQLSQLEAIGLDTETTELHPRKGKLRLIQLSDGKTTYILDMQEHFPLSRGILQPLKDLLEAELPRKVMHNAKFDCLWIRVGAGIVVGGVFDTYLADVMVAAGTLGINMYGHALDDCVRRYLKIDMDKELQQSNWSGHLEEAQYQYAALDPKATLLLRPVYIDRIVQNGLQNTARIEFGAVHAFGELELNGFAVNKNRYMELLIQLAADKKRTHAALSEVISPTQAPPKIQSSMFEDIDEIAYGAINFNSHIQVKKAFRELGVPLLNEKDDEELIKQYKAQDLPFATSTAFKHIEPLSLHFPVLLPLLDYRKAEKAITSYGTWLKDGVIEEDGRIYSQFWQLRAETGRTSNSDPNLQQVPNPPIFRRCFQAPEGRKLVVADYSQFELRILAELCQDPVMLQLFRDDKDMHSMTTAGVFGLDYDEIQANGKKYKVQRGFAKQLNFSVAYGISAWAYALKTHCTLEEAEQYLAKFADTYPVMNQWLNDTGNKGLRTLSSRTKAGRLVAFMKPTGKDAKALRGQQGAVRRNARNTPIQGLNADVLKVALPRVYNAIQGYDAKLVHEIHDEIIVESAESCAQEISHILEREMREAAEIYVQTVPIKVGADICDDWSEKG